MEAIELKFLNAGMRNVNLQNPNSSSLLNEMFNKNLKTNLKSEMIKKSDISHPNI